jgi:hypothetical protein
VQKSGHKACRATKIPLGNNALALSPIGRQTIRVAHAAGDFIACPEISPMLARNGRVFNKVGGRCRRPER